MKLDYCNMISDDGGIAIQLKYDPSSRVWVNAEMTHVELQHEYCDIYMRGNEEIEEWSWHIAARQPDAKEQKIILKELRQYAANEIISSNKVC